MRPKSIWNRPQKMAANAIETSTVERLPPGAVKAPVTRVAVMTVIGPVGPEIWLCVPPKRAAKKPNSVAPTKPA